MSGVVLIQSLATGFRLHSDSAGNVSTDGSGDKLQRTWNIADHGPYAIVHNMATAQVLYSNETG